MTKDARTCPPPCVASGCGGRVDRVRVSAAGTGPRTFTWRRVLRSLLELLVEGRRSTIQMRGLALSEPDVPVALGGKMIEYFAAAAADSAESSGVARNHRPTSCRLCGRLWRPRPAAGVDRGV